MIRVILLDGREAEVLPAVLQQLLETGEVECFLRQSGWVDPRCDPIRRNPMKMIGLPERRESMRRLIGSDQPFPLNQRQTLFASDIRDKSVH